MSKITESARGEDCQIRLYGVCNFDPDTTVFAHLPGAGMGNKAADLFGAYGCSSCHAAVDGGQSTKYSRQELDLAHYEGVRRTQEILLARGLVVISGAKR